MKQTEMRNPLSTHIDKMSTEEMVELFNKENMNAVNAVSSASKDIARAIDLISDALTNGGRLFYIGAGTSGRLGVLDASECPPTFGVSPETVVGIIAGGEKALVRASEGAEDSLESGALDVRAHNIDKGDVLVGISAAGDAAYVIGAMRCARERGCATVSLTSNRDAKINNESDISIITETGAEIISGSTRLKAGTAQKLVLNMLSTCAMVKTGKVVENLMINLKPTNIKLKRRMISITQELTGLEEREAEALLEAHAWDIRSAAEHAKNR